MASVGDAMDGVGKARAIMGTSTASSVLCVLCICACSLFYQ